MRGEEPRHGRGERSGIWQDLVGLRPAFEPKARQPERDVEPAVADAREIPVDEDCAGVEEAEIVAANVQMEQLVAGKLGLLGCAKQHR